MNIDAYLAAAATTLITGLGGLMFAVLNSKLNSQHAKVEEIHVLVNSRLEEALRDIAELKAALLKARRAPAEQPILTLAVPPSDDATTH